MSFLRNITSGFRSLFRKEKVDQDLNEEFGAYLEMAAEEKMKDGMSRKEALRAVRLERGSLEVTKEVVRSGRWESFVETSWQDLRFAARILRKNPGFTLVAVLTAALGIAANVTVFSVIDGLFLRSVPAKNPERLVRIVAPENDGEGLFSIPEFAYLRDRTITEDRWSASRICQAIPSRTPSSGRTA